jgi:hypothetical protein
MAFKAILIIVVIAILMEDSASIKKTVKEEEEDRELAEKVNATLAEEKKRQEEEDEKNRNKKKKTTDEKKDKMDLQGGQSEAGPSLNCTCPVVRPCRPCQDCPVTNCTGQCGSCPVVKPNPDECLPCEECGECPEVTPCRPCHSCPVSNSTVEDSPTVCQCPEGAGLSLPAAVAVGAVTGVVVTGTAAIIGLILRYVSPIVSGFIFVATIIIIWYLCSHYPETARELGARAATLLREAATTLGHRLVEALQRHTEQVGVPVLSLISSYFLI